MARIVNRSLNKDWTYLIWDVWQNATIAEDVAVLEATKSANFQELGRWYAQIKQGGATSVSVEVTLDPYEYASQDNGTNPDICTWTEVGNESTTERIEFFTPLTAIRVKFSGASTEPAKVVLANS